MKVYRKAKLKCYLYFVGLSTCTSIATWVYHTWNYRSGRCNQFHYFGFRILGLDINFVKVPALTVALKESLQ
jgi:hypothetical protein